MEKLVSDIAVQGLALLSHNKKVLGSNQIAD